MAFNFKEFTNNDEYLRKEQKKESHLQSKPGEYTYSDKLAQAYADRDSAYASKPGDFSYLNQSAMDAVWDKIQNREKFTYDVNGDALFQQYKDMYTTQGKLAMMDTMGQAAAMTGGYGNSYTQTAGNQAYQSSLQQLGAIVPELYSLAYDKYNQETQDLYNQYGLYQSDYATKYGEHRDAVSDWQTNLNYLAGVADSLYNQEYEQYRDRVSDWQNMLTYLTNEADTAYNRAYGQYIDDRNLAYQDYQDAISNAQTAASNTLAREKFEYEKEQNAIAAQQAAAQAEAEANKVNLYTYMGADPDNKNNVVFRDSAGKTYSFEKGINPYTGTTNPDARNGNTWSNGYQPDNVGGSKLTKTGETTNVNGREQNIWTTNGKNYVWDGTANKYYQVKMVYGHWVVQ